MLGSFRGNRIASTAAVDRSARTQEVQRNSGCSLVCLLPGDRQRCETCKKKKCFGVSTLLELRDGKLRKERACPIRQPQQGLASPQSLHGEPDTLYHTGKQARCIERFGKGTRNRCGMSAHVW